jgi:S-adenosyl methyltransferase
VTGRQNGQNINDPLVLTHARALLTSTREGATAYLDADLRDTDKILAQAAATLDFSQPVAIMLIAILHYIEDLDQAHRIVARLLDAVPSGSFLVITHAGIDLIPWRPDSADEAATPTTLWGGVALKP